MSPILASLRGYKADWLARDAVAGAMLAAIAIPEQLATAKLAGVTPETGLYAFAGGAVGFALFGASRFISIGADTTITPIFAGALSALALAGGRDYPTMAALFALAVGVVLVIAGLARAGWLADLLSVPVTVGFLAGISIHIAVGQLPAILAVPNPGGETPALFYGILRELPATSPVTLLIAALVLAAALGGEKLGPRLPGALVGLALAAGGSLAFGLPGRGIPMVGALAAHPPHPPALPSLATAFHDFTTLMPLVLIVAMVCMVQTAAVARSFPTEGEDAGRDFIGVGAGCLLAGLLGAFPVNASPPRTAVVAEAGGRSQAAGLAAVVITLLLLAFASGSLAYVPQAALGGVLVFVAIRIFRLRDMIAIVRSGGYEFALVVAAGALVIALPVETGVLLAIVLSLLHSLYVLARPACGVMARVPGTSVWWPPEPGAARETVPGVLVFAVAAPLTFTNASFVRRRIEDAIAAAAAPVKLLVIEASGIIDIDYTGAQTVIAGIARLRAQGTDVALARLSSQRGQAAGSRTGLLAALGPGHEFHAVQDAIDKLAPRP